MVVQRRPGELYLLCHTAGPEGTCWVERIHPESLATLDRSPDLPGGPVWPGGIAAHASGDLHVVFGNHAHRLDAACALVASATLPRHAPYNSFVVLPDGTLATKDFGKDTASPAELLFLDPATLDVVERLDLPERSIARLSADGDDVYVVGDTSLLRVRGGVVEAVAAYRTLDGQTYGWDAVLDDGAAWLLDDGEGTEAYAGTFRGRGASPGPLHLVRVDLATGAVRLAEVCGEPRGLVANPPVVDPERRLAVGFDSSNRALTGFDADTLEVRWRRTQDHASHMVRYPESGELVTFDHDPERMSEDVVVLDITSGEELARAATGSAVQGVLFPAPGFDGDVYAVTFAGVSRIRPA